MSLIVSIMGPTCAGKTTFIQHCTGKMPGRFASVKVGAIMRAKYPPSYFNGQNNPAHTAQEAWDLCEEIVNQHIESRVDVILVDGQPRDSDQVDRFLSCWGETPRAFLLFDAPLKVREDRARENRKGDDLDKLAIPRLTADMVSYYSVLVRMAEYGISPLVVDTSHSKPGDALAMHLINQGKKAPNHVRPQSLCRSWPHLAGSL